MKKIQDGYSYPRMFYNLGDSSNETKQKYLTHFLTSCLQVPYETGSSMVPPSPHVIMQVGHSVIVYKDNTLGFGGMCYLRVNYKIYEF